MRGTRRWRPEASRGASSRWATSRPAVASSLGRRMSLDDAVALIVRIQDEAEAGLVPGASAGDVTVGSVLKTGHSLGSRRRDRP